MEVVGAIVGAALTEPFRFVFGSIYSRIKNRFKIYSHCNYLKENMESLLNLKQLLDDDELQRRCLPRTRVQDWLKGVAKMEKEYHSMQHTITANGNTSSTSCLRSLDFKLSNDIASMVEEVKQLIKDGREYENMTVGHVTVPVERLPAPSIKGQPTAERNLAELMNLLKDKKAKRIGVCGMGGVGKTTLIKNLNNELSKDTEKNKLFSIVIWVVVSRQRSLKELQSQIAGRLKMQIAVEESDEPGVACRLYNRLENEKSFLIILDDVWGEIDLDQVGIPRPESHTGSKIILTTRSKDVCRQMLTDKDFELHRLSIEESWKLFSQHVGEEVINDNQIKEKVEAVVKECDGLPLAIVAVGASMRNKRNISLWNDALYALRRSTPPIPIEDKVFKPLKWSYDSLEGAHLKSCFLFFCLFPEDFEVYIHNLVPYWLAEGLLDQEQNYEQLHDRCIAIVDSLKDSCLLESGHFEHHVKMHDVVRDVGIWIATSSNENWCKSFIRAGVGQTDISLQQLSECSNGTKRISFMNNYIASLPDRGILSPEASTLFLQGNYSLREVPNSFLQGFPNLRILDLSGTNIKSLPPSLLQVGELRALILRGCSILSELPPLLAELGMLQVLDCCRSGITKLPGDFEKLTNLRQLDLSHTRKLQEIPIEKISKLCSLEFLNTCGRANIWGMRKTDEENLLLEKLLCLDKLIVLYVELEDVPHITSQHVSWPGRINNFYVHFGPNSPRAEYLPNRKMVVFDRLYFSGDESVGWLLVNASKCKIWKCEGVDVMLDNMVVNNANIGRPFANLKILFIHSVKLPSMGQQHVANFDLLPNLEELNLRFVSGLKSLTDLSNLLGLRFSKLKCIQVQSCPQLENLFTMDGTPQKLEELKTIEIDRCEKLTEVFMNLSSNNFIPKLQSLKLGELSALEEICKGDASWQSLEKLRVVGCEMLKKLPLGIQNAERIQFIKGEQHWWDELQWDTETSKMRLQPHFKLWW